MRVVNKKINAKRKYQLEITRKPKLTKIFGTILIKCFVIMLIFEVIFTQMLAADYIRSADAKLSLASNYMDEKIGKIVFEERFCKANFNEESIIDGQVYATSEDEEIRSATDRANAALNMRVSMPYYFDFGSSFISNLYKIYWSLFHFYKNLYDDMNLYHSILFNQNGDCIAKGDAGIYAILSKSSNKESNSNIYQLDICNVNKVYPEFMQDITDLLDPSKNGNLYAEIAIGDIVYIKDGYIIPEKLFVKYGSKLNANGETAEYFGDQNSNERVVETFDFSSCDLSTYEKVEISKSDYKLIGPLALKLSYSPNYHKERIHTLSDEDVQNALKQMQEKHLEDFDVLYETSQYSIRAIRFHKISETGLVAAIAIDYDMFRDLHNILLFLYLLILFVTVLVAYLIARNVYIKKNLAYEVDSYRRKTTNAMAHDLKTPLMAISGYAENLQYMKDTEKVSEYATNILNCVKNMDGMIVKILELAKLEDGKLTLLREDISLKTLVEESMPSLKKLLDANNMKFSMNGDCILHADKQLMRRLLENLFSNAIKYGKDSSTIVLVCEKNRFAMQNEYEGDVIENPNKLLQPFVKGELSRNNTQGNGLGLSIVEEIATVHDYKVQIHCQENHVFEVVIVF